MFSLSSKNAINIQRYGQKEKKTTVLLYLSFVKYIVYRFRPCHSVIQSIVHYKIGNI